MQICLNLAGLFNIFSQSCRPVDLEHCCTALESTTLREKVLYPATAAYYSSVESYFAVNARLTPTCIVQPETADDVALAVSTLTAPNRIQKCQFAIRSGGHTSWAGAANIEQGVTIDLSHLNSTTFHPENYTVSILPGARWGSVYKTLHPLGVMVTGGRASPVGAGGITLGGGNSFFASRYGLVCDSVVNFEVVLANGEIVNANNETNADLFKALKGGSNNFGIVTKIDFAAFEHTGVWGGVILHDISTTSQQIPAFVNFTDHVVDDPYASLITSWDYSSTRGKSVISNILVHTKPIERASSFDEVLAIPSLSSTMRLTNMHDLTEELHLPPEMRGRFLTLTFKNDPRLIQKALDLRDSSIKIAKAKARSSEWLFTAFFQPLPKLFSQHSVAKGGNVIGLDRFDENLLLFLVAIGWKDTVDDSLFDSLGKATIEQLDAYAKELGADNEWIYLNYADVSQNPLRSYGEENLAEIRRVAEKYDPEHVFQYQVPGGFKVGRT
ncbi:CAZyme family AA7 [Paecilomyces variotii]|uniref:FAD-binding PCMH-type domain-containing protein n=1 Tax=Byssochlamys spectabilis TaxID=264951 RepID=A0A443I1U7_BYSSP|nr:hypothetical protein C8Q69DRAFT_457527 [Paecilomyces variotii]KAJ9216273.1 CAZyme family AA7 [Paecilomyces variotii]KAJ9236845.1 CAZyme family AA7 [Paecilomyces variotii]KAJ9362272.1 CAZyme family AA7 [Paecilomyces variotii]KAJ9368371.1 CAZyme family AA7 [Paecilomyces variotii]RWQ98026.1 hypothetical protein C8Q69DRAFT_457527 [Paecilomyces variotii]